jgi:hypothetical protein
LQRAHRVNVGLRLFAQELDVQLNELLHRSR